MTPKVEAIFKEFHAEVPATRRLLERVPGDKLGWKPHHKSRSLGELTAHIAGLPAMVERIATSNEVTPCIGPPLSLGSLEEIRERFEQHVRECRRGSRQNDRGSRNGTVAARLQGQRDLQHTAG